MRTKLNGLSLTFRLSAEQSELVAAAMKVERTSNVSEFVRRLLLKGAEQILEDESLRKARRVAIRAAVEASPDLSLGSVVEYPPARLPGVPKPPATG